MVPWLGSDWAFSAVTDFTCFCYENFLARSCSAHKLLPEHRVHFHFLCYQQLHLCRKTPRASFAQNTHATLQSSLACISRGSQTPGSERAKGFCRFLSTTRQKNLAKMSSEKADVIYPSPKKTKFEQLRADHELFLQAFESKRVCFESKKDTQYFDQFRFIPLNGIVLHFLIDYLFRI